MGAKERAQIDIEGGDYGRARQRLASYLTSKGYDPRILAQLGDLSHDMHDYFQAGRFWLLSDAEGEHVEFEISSFIAGTGGGAKQIVSHLPRSARMASLDAYPPIALERLRRLGLDDVVLILKRRPDPQRVTWRERALTLMCVLVAVWFLFVFIVGCERVFSWFLGED